MESGGGEWCCERMNGSQKKGGGGDRKMQFERKRGGFGEKRELKMNGAVRWRKTESDIKSTTERGRGREKKHHCLSDLYSNCLFPW